MRIIAGKHKGRKIETKAAPHIRPTSGFAREAIFNIVGHGIHAGAYQGNAVADLCCGSGAFGLEALSRGAASVTFVDMDHQALLGTKANVERFGEHAQAVFLRADVAQLPPAKAPFALLFLDPPYFSGLIPPCLTRLASGGWMDADSLLIVEHDAREKVALPAAFAEIDTRRYGRASIRLIKLKDKT